MSEQHKNFPEFYVTAPQACPYLAGRFERKLFTHLTHDKAPALVDNLLRGGFRRSQNVAYTPYCEGCQACVSVRVLVNEFVPSRSFRRVSEANTDLVSQRLAARPTSEQYSLFRNYIDTRHSDGGMADMTVLDYAMMVEDSIVDTYVTEYRLKPNDLELEFADEPAFEPRYAPGGYATRRARRQDTKPLLAASLTDRLTDGLSMVYSFYDTELTSRSLGTYMILDHIERTRQLGLPYLYLGYWIDGSRKMSYKARFLPQERLGGNGWVRAEA